MRKISINFNQNGRFLQLFVNSCGVRFLFAVAIPYPWYGKYMIEKRFEEPKTCWHLRYKPLVFSFV